MPFNLIKLYIDKVLLLFLIFFYLIFNYYFQLNIIGYWESVAVYSALEPGSYPVLGNIQIAADTTGGHGIPYPLILISKYIAKFFTISFSSIKYIFKIYSIIFLIFYFFIIKYLTKSIFISFFSTILFITNPYFLYMGNMLISQQLTLTLIFLNLFLFIKYQKNNSFFNFIFLSISISALLMNYIIGRYIVLFLIFYFWYNSNNFQNFNKNIFLKNILTYLKLIFTSVIFLILIFPPNLASLFSKNILFPFTTLSQGGETLLFENNILKIIYFNLKYLLNNFFFNSNSDFSFNIINSEPTNIFPLIASFFLIIGFIKSFKKKELYLITLIAIIILFLILFSNTEIKDNALISSSISVYRLYLIVPFLNIFIVYGVVEFTGYISKSRLLNYYLKYFILLFLISTFFLNIYKSNVKFRELQNIYSNIIPINNNYNDLFYSNSDYRRALDYHFKIRSISNKIVSVMENKTVDKKLSLNFFYIDFDRDLNFLKHPPRLRNDDIYRYARHIFFLIYINDYSKQKNTFLFNTKHEKTLLKKITEIKNRKFENSKNNFDKIIAKKIAILLNYFFTFENAQEEFKYYEVNYFHDYKNVILFNDQEYSYVKNFLNMPINVIKLSELLNYNKMSQ